MRCQASNEIPRAVFRRYSSRGIAHLGSIYAGNAQGQNFWDTLRWQCTDLGTDNLSVQEMFPDHDRVDRGGILKREESKTPRLAVSVPNDGAGVDLPNS